MLTHFRCYLSCLASFVAVMLIGMIISFPSPAFPDINQGNYGFKLSSNAMSWLASFSGLFAVPGTIIIVPVMDNYGRKFATVMITVPMAVGWLTIICSFNATTLAIGRALLGLAIGMASVLSTVYITEVSPKQIRGQVVVIAFTFFNLGGFLVNLLGAFVNWRWISLAGLMTVVAFALSTIYMFETPRWLLKHGDTNNATNIMKLTWGLKEIPLIQYTCIEAKENLKSKITRFIHNFIKLIQPPLWKPFIITQMLMVFQQFTGFGYITSYTVSIFKAAVSKNTKYSIISNPHYQSCMLFIGGIIGTLIALVVIDRFGRRILLISSGCLISLSLAAIGTHHFLQINNGVIAERYLSWIPLTSLMVMVISFGFSYNLVPSLLASELFAINMRGTASGISMFIHYLLFFVVVKVFNNFNLISNYGTFWIFALCTLVSVIFVILFVPETKGKSLEELQQHFSTYPSFNEASK